MEVGNAYAESALSPGDCEKRRETLAAEAAGGGGGGGGGRTDELVGDGIGGEGLERRRYSREEMEAMRVLDAAEQRSTWKEVYESFGLAFVEEYDGVGGEGLRGRRRRYSREEMEAMRFVDVMEQRRWWKELYDSFGLDVVKDYDGLGQQKQSKRKDDPQQRRRRGAGRKEEAEEEPSFVVGGEVFVDNVMNGSDVLSFSDIICDESFAENLECVGSNEVRSNGDDDSSSDEYASIQKPAFFVEGEPDFESGPPQDGLEYLRRVRWEAAQIPKITVAKFNLSKNSSEQTPYMPKIPDIPKCPPNLMPSKEWEDAFLAEFSHIRQTFSWLQDSCNQQSIMKGGANSSKQHDLKQRPCGLPTTTALLSMEVISRATMLRNLVNMLESAGNLSKDDCIWLFALCVAIDTPLDADMSATLRSLLRKCASLLARKSELDDEVVMLNMLVTITGKYFGQLDR